MKQFYQSLAVTGLFLLSVGAQAADWQVDNSQSKLNFISTKKEHVAEVHHFESLSGELSSEGQFSLAVDLASVKTGFDIRDQRMQEFLFNVADFPKANINAKLDPAAIEALAVGESKLFAVDGELSLHGQSQPLTFNVLVSKLSEDKLLAVSAQPVVLNVADYELVKGVEKLRELAGLPSISHAVPVSFYLTLNAM
jgi:polyisoprenoid-binding protein YceI